MAPNFLNLLEDEIALPATVSVTTVLGVFTAQVLAAQTPEGTRAIVGYQTGDALAGALIFRDNTQQIPKSYPILGTGAAIASPNGNPVSCRMPLGGGTQLTCDGSGFTAAATFLVTAWLAVRQGRC
jgi:hypothetical protein